TSAVCSQSNTAPIGCVSTVDGNSICLTRTHPSCPTLLRMPACGRILCELNGVALFTHEEEGIHGDPKLHKGFGLAPKTLTYTLRRENRFRVRTGTIWCSRHRLADG